MRATRDVLGLAFERTWSYLGDEELDAMCARHIEAHSSHSDKLRDYGGDFPGSCGRPCPPMADELLSAVAFDPV